MLPERDSALIERLDELLLAVRQQIDERLPNARADIVSADELYVVTGQIDASLRAAVEHIEAVRETLVRSVRGGEAAGGSGSDDLD